MADMIDAELDEIEMRLKAAGHALGEACKRGHIRMSVPARPVDDDDCIIQDGIDAGESALTALRETRAKLREAERDGERLDKLIEWLGIRDNFSESGCRDWADPGDARIALDEWHGDWRRARPAKKEPKASGGTMKVPPPTEDQREYIRKLQEQSAAVKGDDIIIRGPKTKEPKA